MKISIVIAYYLLVITVLESSQKLTWFEAQTLCRDKNQTLTLNQNESNQFYWTGFYKRTSHWIKIIGCYEQSTINTSIIHESDLTIMAPGFCQEICLDKNASLFAVQGRRCVCLSSSFDYSTYQKPPSECSYKCDNSTLLTGECGGESAYNVYMTDLSRSEISSPCLSLQCGSDPQFSDFSCDRYLPSICSRTNLTTNASTWRDGMEHCKNKSTYLIGNANIYDYTLNVTLACTGLNNSNQRWIGVVRDLYVKSDQGQLIEDSDHHLFNTCQKCKASKQDISCTYEDCNTALTRKAICNQSVITVTPVSNTTERGSSTDSETVSTMDTTQHTEKQTESPVAAVVVPVVLVIVLAVCGAVVALYVKRKKQSQDEESNGANKSTQLTTECYSDIDNNINKNYFVLQQNNPSYELADDIQIHTKAESPYNEAEDGTYDHLGDKDARKQPNDDDTYNHASVVMSPDLSDYDVANQKQVLEEDTTYDHTSPAENSYGHFNTSPTQETDYSGLF